MASNKSKSDIQVGQVWRANAPYDHDASEVEVIFAHRDHIRVKTKQGFPMRTTPEYLRENYSLISAPKINPFESLHATIVCDSKDYSLTKRDAWIYAIVVGYDDKVLRELKKKRWGWDDETIDRLKQLRNEWVKVRKLYEAQITQLKNMESNDGSY